MPSSILSYRLKDLLEPSKIVFSVNPLDEYKQIKVKVNHKGVELRGIKKGADIGSKQFLAKKGQFIISKIDARNGAMGIIPQHLDNALVTGDFLLFDFNRKIILPEYFSYITKTSDFSLACKKSSEGSTNRVRLKPDRFMNILVNVPSLTRQTEIIETIRSLQIRIEELTSLRSEQIKALDSLLFSKYTDIVNDAECIQMKNVAPIIRRVVSINDNELYPELGIRCFGKGTFFKPALSGLEIGTKKIFQIKEGDLIFSNVFAWEGGIAVANKEDSNRYGSHRFISCVADPQKAESEFLCYHFLSPKGLEDINACSPGGAGRNRTLGLSKLMKILVPIPSLELQKEFIKLIETVKRTKDEYRNATIEIAELIPSYLDKIFKENLPNLINDEIDASSARAADRSAQLGEKETSNIIDQDYMQLAMILSLIESKLGISYGEVAIQKTVFNVEAFYSTINKKYDFVNYHYGTYSGELREIIKNCPFVCKKNVKDNEVFMISPLYKKQILDAITSDDNKIFVASVNRVLDIYTTPFINKETDKIELLNTVTKLIKDLKTTDVQVIYQGMKDWKIRQSRFATKADKFSFIDTKKTIELIKSNDLITSLENRC